MWAVSRKYEKFIFPALFLSLGFHLLAAFVPQEVVEFVLGLRASPRSVRFEVVSLAPEPTPVYRTGEPPGRVSGPGKVNPPGLTEPLLNKEEGDSAVNIALSAPEPSGRAIYPEIVPPVQDGSKILEPDSSAAVGAYIEDIFTRINRARRYPEACRRLGQEGEVEVGFVIGRQGGLAGETTLTGPSPFAPLNRAARRSVELCSPFPPLPDCVREDCLALKVIILYRLQ